MSRLRGVGRGGGLIVLAAACLGVATATVPVVAAPSSAEVVFTDSGPVRGVVGVDHRVFQGVPYAAPPTRWAAPRPAAPWREPRDATRPGNACAQSAAFGPGSEHEDCLYLNVTTPRSGRKLPVVVWLHGGAFQFGSGAEYGAERMAALGDVVVVTVDYRLGVFGFLAHPQLAGSGNYGLADQQAALRWVRRNAAAFGGDPGNVTIAGESSGSRSVCGHLVSPASRGLFHRAILQSEPCTMTDWPAADGTAEEEPPGFPRSRQVAERQGEAVARALGCADVACLRTKTPAELLATTEWFAPTYGTALLPVDPAVAGEVARVPVLHGITRDEYRIADGLNEAFGLPPLTAEEYAVRVANFVGPDRAAEVLAAYPVTASPSEAWSAVVTDAVFAEPMVDFHRRLNDRVSTYAYEFADPAAPWMSNVGKPGFPTGAYHTSELQYLFRTANFDEPLTAGQRALGDEMIGYWTRFARTGDPNGHGAPHWPKGVLAHQLAPGDVEPIDFAERHRYDMWKSLP